MKSFCILLRVLLSIHQHTANVYMWMHACVKQEYSGISVYMYGKLDVSYEWGIWGCVSLYVHMGPGHSEA